jgi:acetyl esterase/lipase
MEPWSRALLTAGARVVNVDYRSGPASLRDTIAAVDWAATTWPRLPICTLGFSSGGHLALAADLRGRDLECAVSVSGPLNLRRSSPSVEALAREFFGGRLRRLSPALRPRRVEARTMLVGAKCDDKVPYRGQRRAAKALGARFVSVAAGEGGRALHCPTDAGSYREAMAAQMGFVSRAFDRARPHR